MDAVGFCELDALGPSSKVSRKRTGCEIGSSSDMSFDAGEINAQPDSSRLDNANAMTWHRARE